MKAGITFLFLILTTTCFAQNAQFTARLSSDSLLIGNYFEIRFEIENTDGEFEAPNFEGFEVVGGPNVSSSMTIINGDKSEKKSYSYYIKPIEEGRFFIGEAFLTVDDLVLNTQPLQINVYPNPNGIVETPKLDNFGMDFNFGTFPDFDFQERKNEPKEAPKSSKRKVKRRKI